MGAAFLITLREGLEAVLIVAIVMAYLRQLDRRDQFLPVMLGAFAGVAVAVGVGAGFYVAIGKLDGNTEHYVAAITTLTAASVLTWMVFWMRKQARSIGGELRGQVDNALANGAMLGMITLVFTGVLREGLETALFMLTVIFDSNATDIAIGGFAGLAIACAIGYSIYRGSHFVNLRVFFQITGGFIILFAAGLFAKGIFQLQTLGVFNSLYFPVWDLSSNSVLGTSQFALFMRGIFGWSSRPSIEQVVIWVAYVSAGGWFFYFGQLPRSVTDRIDAVRNSIANIFAVPSGAQVVTELERPES